ncbi:MAG: aminoacetone oxidase family FAD-binding enzyme [Acidobacteria bacterium]|nr:MAG: aminoacetone oxidase family FAD-binding enzyme [Acidobacteriota bacterium]
MPDAPQIPSKSDVVVIGAGAAGLATAIAARRADPSLRVVVLDGASRPGAKILISGGTRCNVTNGAVTEADFWGGRRTVVRNVLRAFRVADTVAFFRDMGVTLHEEPGGKLFPDSNRARDVLAALLAALERCGASLVAPARAHRIEQQSSQFLIETSRGPIEATVAVLATGGQSLPKTGSDGAGYAFARDLGHTIVPTTPALAPLLLDATSATSIHGAVSGVALDVEIVIWIDNAVTTRLAGALLWTHFGASGPVVLDASRHWARARLEQRAVRLTVNFFPGATYESLDARWRGAATERPRSSIRTRLAASMPESLATAILRALHLDGDQPLAHLSRADRRRLARMLVEWPLSVTETRGYNFAEVTAGGVDITEIDPSTMQSRRCPGLFLVGEILDVDGRIGGFNFQWAWATGHVAGRALSAAVRARQ